MLMEQGKKASVSKHAGVSKPAGRLYLVTRVVQGSDDPDSSIKTYLCDIAKPFVWYRNESAGFALKEGSGNEG